MTYVLILLGNGLENKVLVVPGIVDHQEVKTDLQSVVSLHDIERKKSIRAQRR